MNPKNNILQELEELNSRLSAPAQVPYTVPAGYFDGLVAQVISRIKALEAANAADELGHLSPVLSRVSKQMPYTVPAGYFESVEGRIAAIDITHTISEQDDSAVLSNLSKANPYTIPAGYFESVESRIAVIINNEPSAKEELEGLSPLLSSLKKTNPYSLPDGYFETIAAPVKEEKPAAKVVSLGSRKWFRLAAAAVVTGVIVLAGMLFLNKEKVTPSSDSYAWLKKNINKVSTEKIEEFIQLTDEEKLIKETVASADSKIQEVKELVKDIPEEEIQSLLSDTQVLDEVNEEIAAEETLLN